MNELISIRQAVLLGYRCIRNPRWGEDQYLLLPQRLDENAVLRYSSPQYVDLVEFFPDQISLDAAKYVRYEIPNV